MEYLIRLVLTIWGEGEYFSGKRPFGNSGWEDEIYCALVRANLFPDDGDGYIDYDSRIAAHRLITESIRFLLEPTR